MRILLTGNSKTWKVSAGIERALRRAGHETYLIDDRRIKRKIGHALTQKYALWRTRRFKPEFILLDKCRALELETVAEMIRGVPNSMWYHDPAWVRRRDLAWVRHIMDVARLADTFFVTGFDDEWRELGFDAKFLPAAGDAGIRPVPPDPAFGSDVAFVGTGTEADRAEVLIEIAKHSQLRVWGTGWERWRKEINWTGKKAEREAFAAVCCSSKITLGINPNVAARATNWVSNRQWLTLLAGGFYLGQGTPGLDELVHDGVHCAFYTDREDCIRQIHRWLPLSEERARIQAQGEAFARRYHTFDQRIDNLLAGQAFINPLA